ncbi:hypothetical protein pipiens_008606, partial [Culex pipiens pipiens]
MDRTHRWWNVARNRPKTTNGIPDFSATAPALNSINEAKQPSFDRRRIRSRTVLWCVFSSFWSVVVCPIRGVPVEPASTKVCTVCVFVCIGLPFPEEKRSAKI